MEPEYVFMSAPQQPGIGPDPTATAASLQYHLVGVGILDLLRQAWDRASEPAKSQLADRILSWAGSHLTEIRVTDLVAHVLRNLVADGRLALTDEQERTLVDLLYKHMIGVLQSKDSRWDIEKVRDALVVAAKQRLAEVGEEVAVGVLAKQPEIRTR